MGIVASVLHTTTYTDATTPNIVGLTILRDVASHVCTQLNVLNNLKGSYGNRILLRTGSGFALFEKNKKTRKETKYSKSKFIVQSNPVNTQTEGVLESVRVKERLY